MTAPVHHADVLTVQGASYLLRDRGIDTLLGIRTQNTTDCMNEPVASMSSVASAAVSSVTDISTSWSRRAQLLPRPARTRVARSR